MIDSLFSLVICMFLFKLTVKETSEIDWDDLTDRNTIWWLFRSTLVELFKQLVLPIDY